MFAPSIALEVWARNEIELVPYFQDGYRYRLEAKKLMFDRIDCPNAIAMGTSMTEVAINDGTVAPYERATGDRSYSPMFAFASPGTRPLAMLGIWRWLDARGCHPKTLFIEVTPVIMNIDRGEDFERSFMDWRMQLDIPEERFELADYDLRFRFDLATWWRSYAYRNREPIVHYLGAELGIAKPKPPIAMPMDGNLHVTTDKGLSGSALAAHYRTTRNTFLKREFKYRYTPSYATAILLIVEEAQAAGTKVVLHTPPVPEMFHEFMMMIDATRPYCDFYDAATARPDVHWYTEHRRQGVPTTQFSDWLHLNREGAIQYAARLFAASTANTFPRDPGCRGRY